MNQKKIFILTGVICVIILGYIYVFERRKPDVNLTSRIPVVTEDVFQNHGTAAPAEPRLIKVYIAGEVNVPGVYEVPEDARVDDVLQKAGGATEEADLLRINLAAFISDAEQIIIPAIGVPLETDTAGAESGDISTAANGLIDINTAGESALTTLPGIGPVIAKNIIDYRETNGKFRVIDDIKNVSLIGPKTFENIKNYITVSN